jgi:hypothetical protein
MLGVLIDQHAGDKGVWTSFFGRLASTTPFPAVLAKKTGAALMPVSIVTSGIARWRVEVDDFIPSREASTAEITARINLSLEKQIQRIRAIGSGYTIGGRRPTRSFASPLSPGVYVPAEVERLKPFRVLIRSATCRMGQQ